MTMKPRKDRSEPSALSPSPSALPPFVRWSAEGCTLEVAVVPNARRTAVDGLHDGALKVRLAALPVEGAANEALVRWLAESIDVPRRQVRLLRGQSSRRKTLAVDADRACVEAWLRGLGPLAGATD